VGRRGAGDREGAHRLLLAWGSGCKA